MFGTFYHCNHLRKCLVGQLHHTVDMVVLLFIKVFIGLPFAADRARQIIAAVSNTLYFGYFAKHTPYLQFTF